MKTATFFKLVVLGAILLIYGCLSAFGGNNNDKKAAANNNVCLELSGTLTAADNKNAFKVELLYFGTPIDSLNVAAGKSFKFCLEKDAYYVIRISGNGYAKKLVGVFTELPEGVTAKSPYKFGFNTQLQKSGETSMDIVMYDTDIASFSHTGLFVYNSNH